MITIKLDENEANRFLNTDGQLWTTLRFVARSLSEANGVRVEIESDKHGNLDVFGEEYEP